MKKKIYNKNFEEFRKLYPRKVGKLTAIKAYEKIIKTYAVHEDIMEGLQNYVEHIDINMIEKSYVKHASTRLNSGGRMDDVNDL